MPTVLTRQEREFNHWTVVSKRMYFTGLKQLCESLAENYKRYHRRMIESNAARFNADGSRADLITLRTRAIRCS